MDLQKGNNPKQKHKSKVMTCGCLPSSTLVEDTVPSLHVVPPYLRPDLPQQSRGYVEHGGRSLEHETDAVDEMLSFGIDVVQEQTQTLAVQHGAHRCPTRHRDKDSSQPAEGVNHLLCSSQMWI